MKQILFICTGNYYRSRYAEALINHEAERYGLPWCAFSRGLAVKDQGLLSPHARQALLSGGIPLRHTAPEPVDLSEACLERADRIIAMKEAEHLPLMQLHFPQWSALVEYWHVHDTDVWPPEQTLSVIERHIELMIAEPDSGFHC